MAGDSLARGARSAVFPPAKVSQERWDNIWNDKPVITVTDGAPPNASPASWKKPKSKTKTVWSK